MESLQLDWEVVSEEEKRALGTDLMNATPGLKRQEVEEGVWFKVDFETVPELVESRRVFLKAGKAYVPVREQMSMVLAGFCTRLDKGLEVRILTSPHNVTNFKERNSSPPAPSPASTKTTASPQSSTTSPKTSQPPTPPSPTPIAPSPAPPSTPPLSTPYPNTSPSACAIST